jgi:hypothetical protein
MLGREQGDHNADILAPFTYIYSTTMRKALVGWFASYDLSNHWNGFRNWVVLHLAVGFQQVSSIFSFDLRKIRMFYRVTRGRILSKSNCRS